MGAQWGSGIGEKIIRNAKGRNGASHKLGLNLSIEEIDKLCSQRACPFVTLALRRGFLLSVAQVIRAGEEICGQEF